MASEEDRIERISTQEFSDALRKNRRRLYQLHALVKAANVDEHVGQRVMIHYQNMVKGIDTARFQLGYALGEASNMPSPYARVDHEYDNTGETPDPVEEQETADLATSGLSPDQCLMEIRKRGKTVFKDLQDLHRKVRLPDTFLYLYLEKAILHVREVRSSAGVVYSELFDQDSNQ